MGYSLKIYSEKKSDYPTNSTVGNYSDKSETLGKPAKTGVTEGVNNIYDMGGNTWELTTEVYANNSDNSTARGGNYDYISSETPAACRLNFSSINVSAYFSFRTTLYL